MPGNAAVGERRSANGAVGGTKNAFREKRGDAVVVNLFEIDKEILVSGGGRDEEVYGGEASEFGGAEFWTGSEYVSCAAFGKCAGAGTEELGQRKKQGKGQTAT
jgi:hypothetical protein